LPPSDIKHAYNRLYAFVEPKHLANGWDRDRIINEINAAGMPCFSGSCPEKYDEKAFVEKGLQPKSSMPIAKELGPPSLAPIRHFDNNMDDIGNNEKCPHF